MRPPSKNHIVAIVAIKYIQRYFHYIRHLKKKWDALETEEKARYRRLMWKWRLGLVIGSCCLGAGLAANYQRHLEVTPITNRKRYLAFTKEQCNKIAMEEYEEV